MAKYILSIGEMLIDFIPDMPNSVGVGGTLCYHPHQPAERLDQESNNRIYRENRDRSLAEVQELFQRAHQQFLQQVNLLTQTLSEEDLNASSRFAWAESWPGFSPVAVIADNSYEHYQDHRQQIQRWLDASKKD